MMKKIIKKKKEILDEYQFEIKKKVKMNFIYKQLKIVNYQRIRLITLL